MKDFIYELFSYLNKYIKFMFSASLVVYFLLIFFWEEGMNLDGYIAGVAVLLVVYFFIWIFRGKIVSLIDDIERGR